jgi:hypothetical protein
MSLRNPHDPHDLRDKDFDNLPAYVAKGHRLKQLGSIWACSCNQIFSNAGSRRDADFALAYHKKVVVEAIEDSRKGISHYDK